MSCIADAASTTIWERISTEVTHARMLPHRHLKLSRETPRVCSGAASCTKGGCKTCWIERRRASSGIPIVPPRPCLMPSRSTHRMSLEFITACAHACTCRIVDLSSSLPCSYWCRRTDFASALAASSRGKKPILQAVKRLKAQQVCFSPNWVVALPCYPTHSITDVRLSLRRSSRSTKPATTKRAVACSRTT